MAHAMLPSAGAVLLAVVLASALAGAVCAAVLAYVLAVLAAVLDVPLLWKRDHLLQSMCPLSPAAALLLLPMQMVPMLWLQQQLLPQQLLQ